MNSDSLELPALEATSIARDYQKTWFTTFRTEVLEQRKPYVIADAVTPHEIFHVMDIPVVSMQWYSSIIAANSSPRITSP